MLYPALSIVGPDAELVLAVADDHSPTAAESSGDAITLFFRNASARDAARHAIEAAFPQAMVAARDVDDEDWARRSQENLQPITVGRVTVVSGLRDLGVLHPSPEAPAPSVVTIVIKPSMGFGTGHHATTRLCLLALQREELTGRSMLDIGTGSGVLAIAAACLGAAHALGIDNDSDAIHAARENLSLNPDAAGVAFEVIALGDVRLKPDDTGFAESAGSAGSTRLAAFTGLVGSGSSRTSTLADVVVANLTGALLAREARRILRMVRPGGRLIVSGLLASERGQVLAAFHPAEILWESHEEEWVAITFRASNALAWFPV